MSDEHENMKDTVCQIMRWYGFNGEDEHYVANGRIDCVACRSGSSEPFIGIEIHLKGELDTA